MLNENEARELFAKAAETIKQIQSPLTRPYSVAVRRADGQYTVETHNQKIEAVNGNAPTNGH